MEKIVIDANVLFATLISNNRKTRLLLSEGQYQFFAPKFLFVELFEHKDIIIQKSKLSEVEVYELLDNLLQHIHFVSNDFISTSQYWQAYRLCKDKASIFSLSHLFNTIRHKIHECPQKISW